MKKLLLIFTLILSSVSYSETVTLDTTQYRNFTTFLAAFESALDLIVSNDQSLNDDLHTYLFSDDYKQLISDLASFFHSDNHYFNIDDIFFQISGIEGSNYDIVSQLENHNNDFWTLLSLTDEMRSSDNQFYDYLYQWSLGSNVEASKVALESIESSFDNLKISVTQLGDKIDQIIVNAGDSSDLLTDIIEQLQILNNKNGGGSSSQLPVTTVGFYNLEEYGKNANTENLNFLSLTTSGEYNKDVYNLLIHLNEVGSSQNNALISILTNVQEIAASVGGTAEGEDKVEKDIEERGYKAEQAQQELNSITSQSWQNYFSAPRVVSDVYDNLSFNLSDVELPQRITIIDTFHYESSSFTAELDDIGFELPQAALDVAYYARLVFGFIYWTLAFGLALFIFKLWIKLYVFVSQSLMNK